MAVVVLMVAACTPATSTTAPAAPPSVTEQGRRPVVTGHATCQDGGEDASSAGPRADDVEGHAEIDLRQVELDADGSNLDIRFTHAGAVPTDPADTSTGESDTIQWVVWIMDGEAIAHQLRVALTPDGWEQTFDVGDRRVVVDPGPTVEDATITARYDLAQLTELGQTFGWVSLVAYGDPVVQDVCPDRAATSLDPEVQLRFPADAE